MNLIVSELDKLIQQELSDTKYAIKWGKAHYGSQRFGWCIQLVAYHVSVNVVFLNGGKFAKPPELGGETPYVKIRTLEDAQSTEVREWIKQSCQTSGWAW